MPVASTFQGIAVMANVDAGSPSQILPSCDDLPFDCCVFWYNRKSCSWHTLRMRKRAEKESSGKNEANGPRKSKDILGNKVSVKVSKAI